MNEQTSMQDTELTWENAVRAWVLVKVKAGFNKGEVAQRILNAFQMGDCERSRVNRFVIRADVVVGPYDIVVPLSASSPNMAKDIIESVVGTDGVDANDTHVVEVKDHYPNPPHKACGYLANSERNPARPGPLGTNAWG